MIQLTAFPPSALPANKSTAPGQRTSPQPNTPPNTLTFPNSRRHVSNIARGTTDPEFDSVTWIKCSNNMALLALVAYLATRWRHLHQLQIWPPDGTTCISSKSGHQMAQLALVQNLVIRWRHLHCLQSWPPGCITALLLRWIAT